MVRSIVRRRTASRQNLYDLNLMLALMGLPIVTLLSWVLQTANPNWASQLATLIPFWQNQSSEQTKNGKVIVLKATHRAACEKGNDSLNVRPSAGFSTPIAMVPCNDVVAINGAPVWKDGESWSPVVYRNVQGWSVSRLLRKI